MNGRIEKLGRRLGVFIKSIRFRLTVWLAAVLVVILLVFSSFVYYRQAQYLIIDTRIQLQQQAQKILPLYQIASMAELRTGTFQAPDLNSLAGGGLSSYERQGARSVGYESLAVFDVDGQTLQRVGNINDGTINQLMTAWQAANQPSQWLTFLSSTGSIPNLNFENQTLYLVSPIMDERRLLGLLILSSPIDPRGQLPRLLATLALASLGTLAISLLGGYWLASRVMSPVKTITRTARSISESDLHRRLNLKTQDELGELANTFDDMLNRLEKAFDRQRQFTADASHELRTPLTIVSLEADQALSRRRSVEEYERALTVIKSENKFMAHLVNDLLTLARMDAGQTHLKFEDLELGELALEVVDRLNSLASQTGIELHVGDFPSVSVRGDALHLNQLITNLVENAIKYAGGRGHHVHVETGEKTIDGQRFGWLQVEDDGLGIPAEHLPYLFDRFYRVDKARSTRSERAASAQARDQDEPDQGETHLKEMGNSGLGLSIAQWIARAHGGQVVASSEVGKGSTFELQLPLTKV